LAVMCAVGANAKPDWPKAIELLVDAALAGHGPALRELGLLIEMAAPGDARAAHCLREAARATGGLAGFAVIRRSVKEPAGATKDELSQWVAVLTRTNHPLTHYLSAATHA